MSQHVVYKHQVVFCEECGRECKGTYELVNHKAVAHNGALPEGRKTYPEVCPYCNKKISDVMKMAAHLYYHKGKKCRLCGELVKGSRYKHMREKHPTIYK